MTIIYNIKKDKKRIFDSLFVKNNKGKCYLIINNKKYDLCEECPLDFKERNENIIIRLIEIKKMENLSYMFYRCSSLSSLPDISNWNTTNVNNMSDMFLGCSSLSSLPKWYKN